MKYPKKTAPIPAAAERARVTAHPIAHPVHVVYMTCPKTPINTRMKNVRANTPSANAFKKYSKSSTTKKPAAEKPA